MPTLASLQNLRVESQKQIELLISSLRRGIDISATDYDELKMILQRTIKKQDRNIRDYSK